MRTIEELRRNQKLKINYVLEEGNRYAGIVKLKGRKFTCIWGYNDGNHEHVSVSSFNPKILPTWYQMCELKDIFFYRDEMAVQIHPKESDYVHGVGGLSNVLHLWRCKNDEWELLKK